MRPDIEEAVKVAEKAIQRILIDLENDFAVEIDQVQVDTRQFANLKPEIFLIGHT